MKQWKLILVTLLAVLLVCVCTSAMAETCIEMGNRPNGCSTGVVPTKNATCTEDGEGYYVLCTKTDCDNYGIELNGGAKVTIAAKGHKYELYSTITPATCSAVGEGAYQCKVCGDVKRDVIPMVDHKMKAVKAKAAECEATGYTAHEACTVCGFKNAQYMEIAALGHDWDAPKPVEPTCTEQGYDRYYCKRPECEYKVGNAYKTNYVPATGHTYDKKGARVEPTCDKEGSQRWLCSVCEGDAIVETLPKREHKFETPYDVKDATCTTEGVKQYECSYSDCAVLSERVVLPKLDHTYTKKVLYQQILPTCDEDGYERYECDTCGKANPSEKVVLPKLGHSYEKKILNNRVKATCDADGFENYQCDNCGKAKVSENVVLPKLGHDFEHVHNEPATCTTDGYDYYVCKNGCQYTMNAPYKDNIVPKLGHDFTKVVDHKDSTCTTKGYDWHGCSREGCDQKELWADRTVLPLVSHSFVKKGTVAPNCEEQGYDYFYCKYADCSVYNTGADGDKKPWFKDNYTDPTGHKFDKKGKLTPPNCTEAGTQRWLCSVCEAKAIEEEIPATGHAWKLNKVVAPTCTEEGYDRYYCENEGCEFEKGQGKAHKVNFVPATGHDYSKAEALIKHVASTCEKKGSKTYKCLTCGEKETFETDILPHNYAEANWDYDYTPASCTVAGQARNMCTMCGKNPIYKEIPALGHTWDYENVAPIVDATCTTAGEGIVFCVNNVGYKVCNAEKTVSIPALGHKPVDKIIVPATCTGNGLKKVVCKGQCKAVLQDVVIIPATGHDWEVVKTDDATCTTEGTIYKTCKTCGTETTETIAALGHEMKKIVVVMPATCDEKGYTTYTCTRGCDVTENRDEVPALGHNFTKIGEIVAPTCTAKGYTVYKCANKACFETEIRDEVPATGHLETKEVVTLAPTCTEVGSANIVCVDCGALISTKEIAALGHDMVKGAVTAPTCTEDGYTTYECSRCDYTEDKDVTAATGHVDTKEVEALAPTCTEAGKIEVTCKCGEVVETKEVAALGHDLVAGEVTAPTCTEDGFTTYECSRCDYTEDKDVTAATGHVETEEIEALAPTCTEAGKIEVTCKCGEVVETKEVAALGHDMVAGEVTDPTCTEDGYTTYNCSRCDVTEDRDVVAALGHDVSVVVEVLAPTCTEIGNTTYQCVRCDVTEVRDQVAALGHDLVLIENAVEATPEYPGEDHNACTRCDYFEIVKYNKYTKYYYENTLTSFGPTTEELLGEGDWYRVTPIDLSVDGIYTFDLIASNAYVVGTVTITVSEGIMTVSYDVNANHIDVLEESLLLYASKADLAEGNAITVAFGEDINLAELFGEDTKIMVSVMLIGTYDAAGYGVYNFEADAEEIADMIAIID